MKYLRKGFTLIELIIVMAVLGILAAGLLAALDPIEQINRSADNGAKTTANEVLRAAQRYYAAKSGWATNIAALATAGELKSNITTLTLGGTTYNMSYFTGAADATGNLTQGPFACFSPIKSKALGADTADLVTGTRYSVLPTNCTLSGTGVCTVSTGSNGTQSATGSNYCVRTTQ